MTVQRVYVKNRYHDYCPVLKTKSVTYVSNGDTPRLDFATDQRMTNRRDDAIS